MLTKDLFRDSR